MRVILTRLAVCILAMAVFFNGPMARSAFVQAKDDHAHSAATQAAASDHGGNAAAHATPEQTPASHDHANAAPQCCSMCVIATPATLNFAATPAHFDYADVSFALARRDLFGHLVALDPDIPKSSV